MDTKTKDAKHFHGSTSYEEAIGLVGFSKFHYFLILVGGCSLFSSLVASVDITYVLPNAECELQLDMKDRGVLTGAYFIGVVVSSHLLGFLSDTLGRRYILIRALFANIIVYIMASLSPGYWVLLVLRFITGIVLCGVTTCSIVYVGEFHSNAHRTRALMLIACISTTAFVYCAGLGGFILPGEWVIPLFNGYFLSSWRIYYFLVGCVPSTIVASMIVFLPESPKYLLACRKNEEALQVLRDVYRINTGCRKETFPVNNLQLNPEEQIYQLTKDNKSVAAIVEVIWKQTYPLFVPPHLLNMLCASISMFCLFYWLSGVLIWMPDLTSQLLRKENDSSASFCQLVQSNWTGTDFDTTVSFEVECKPVLKSSTFEINALIGATVFVSLMIMTFIMPKLNRKVVVLSTCVTTVGLAITVLRVPNVYVMIAAQGSIVITLNVMFCSMSTLLVDYFPTNLRGMAVGLAIMTGRLGSAVGGHIFNVYLISSCSTLYYVSMILMFLAFLSCSCLRPPAKEFVRPII